MIIVMSPVVMTAETAASTVLMAVTESVMKIVKITEIIIIDAKVVVTTT